MVCAPPITDYRTEATSTISGSGAGVLARAYLAYISGYWRGDASVATFGARLAAFSSAGLPAEPSRQPDAFSPHGAGGRGIRWYACGDEVCGYTPGCATGYRVPMTCIAELAQAVGISPGQTAATPGESVRERRMGGTVTPGSSAQVALVQVLVQHPAAMGAVA